MPKNNKKSKKSFIVKPIPAQVKSLKHNASTPREEALLIQKHNVEQQMNMMKMHHGGKSKPVKTYTVPQFQTGAPCISGQCGNHSSITANKNIMKSKKNSVYDDEVLSASEVKKMLKKGGRKTRKKKYKKNKSRKNKKSYKKK